MENGLFRMHSEYNNVAVKVELFGLVVVQYLS